MNAAAVTAVGDAQRALSAALDAGSPEDIVAATSRLSGAVAVLKAAGGWRVTPDLKLLVERAIAEGEGARIRTRYLADHARTRFARIQTLTGRATERYGRHGRYL